MKKKIYLKYLWNDNGPDSHLNPEIVRGVYRESKEYGTHGDDVEYIIVNPKKGNSQPVEVERKRGDGFDC